MNKSKCGLILPLVLLALAGCAQMGPVKTLEHGAQDAIVVGYISIFYNGVNVVDYANLIFTPGGVYHPGDTKIMVYKLPVGEDRLTQVNFQYPEELGNHAYSFPNEVLGFRVGDGAKAYYIGHIRIDWKGPKASRSAGLLLGTTFGLVGGLAGGLADDAREKNPNETPGTNTVEVTMTVEDRLEELLPKLTRKYPDLRNIEKSLAYIVKMEE